MPHRSFVKRVPLADRWRLEAEADGLARLARAAAIRVPRLLGQGASDGEAWIELEWFDLHPADAAADARTGAALARLHAVTGGRFGLERDNAIGATPQPNAPSDDWIAFWRERRLGHQLDLAAQNGFGGRLQDRGRRLLDEIPAFFAGYRPQPSLLHGDLWGGNRAMLADGTHEHDWPLAEGAAERRDLYNLYHVMNHMNLFGGGYRAQGESMIDRLLAAAGR
jgi:fructosamine-3-kinase